MPNFIIGCNFTVLYAPSCMRKHNNIDQLKVAFVFCTKNHDIENYLTLRIPVALIPSAKKQQNTKAFAPNKRLVN